jgi:hypothetical protein
MGTVLDQDQAMLPANILQFIQLRRLTRIVNSDDGFCFFSKASLYRLGIDIVGVQSDIGEDRFRSALQNAIR